jgi:hypothetical protein
MLFEVAYQIFSKRIGIAYATSIGLPYKKYFKFFEFDSYVKLKHLGLSQCKTIFYM